MVEAVLSALQSLACCPSEGVPACLTPFPLAASVSTAQAGQRADSAAVSICCQVTSSKITEVDMDMNAQ